MVNTENYTNIPAEKFQFAKKSDFSHDSKFATKPVSYWQGAFRRFCKNKGSVVGAVIIACLILFAVIAPFCTPYTPSYVDQTFANIYPKCSLFENTNFWDGCKVKEDIGYLSYFRDYALGLETGNDVIKNGKVETNDSGEYSYRYDTYYGIGFTYKTIELNEYLDIQRYQNETGRQVLYPVVNPSEREGYPIKYQKDADIYYKTIKKGNNLYPVVDKDGNPQPNYWTYKASDGLPVTDRAAEYSMTCRIEGENGVTVDGEQCYYVYGVVVSGGVQVRAYNYEYYRYYHTQVAKDGIEEPYFLFGTTTAGKDIFACLSHGARFSFIFAVIVAVVNLIVGVIWGSIAGYFGGKIDLFMERFTDILGAVPTMIVITLLKYHMGSSSQAIVLFIAFFATGWIGMAGTTRMQFYRYKNQEYILAARTLGARDGRVMFKHILPNAIGTLVTSCALVIPSMIYSETNLSYLGIINLESGNLTSVGTLISAGQQSLLTAPYVALFPSVFLVLLMLSFNLFGNGLRDAFNPSLRGTEE